MRLITPEKLFRSTNTVSLHTPLPPETAGMIRGHHIVSMKPCNGFILAIAQRSRKHEWHGDRAGQKKSAHRIT